MVIDIVRKPELTGLLDLYDLTALVVAALGAGAMRKLAFVTVGTLAERACGEVIVGAAEGRALLGVSPFGICHVGLPFQFQCGTAQYDPPQNMSRRGALLLSALPAAVWDLLFL